VYLVEIYIFCLAISDNLYNSGRAGSQFLSLILFCEDAIVVAAASAALRCISSGTRAAADDHDSH
jgi:hypothetical protein